MLVPHHISNRVLYVTSRKRRWPLSGLRKAHITLTSRRPEPSFSSKAALSLGSYSSLHVVMGTILRVDYAQRPPAVITLLCILSFTKLSLIQQVTSIASNITPQHIDTPNFTRFLGPHEASASPRISAVQDAAFTCRQPDTWAPPPHNPTPGQNRTLKI